ncbi:MAG: beta-carotene ketolase [Calditrichaeota bacterium]|nr:MAG: beta-carotene ketolase [Calditrichota bacterium]
MPDKKIIMSIKGIAIALLTISVWAVSLIFFLSAGDEWPFALKIAAFLWMTFLYTGLFITTHDSMHGVIAPKWPLLNRWIGKMAIILFAFFPYKRLKEEHIKHHRYPATNDDPDYHAPEAPGFFKWYFKFFFHYTSVLQIVLMAATFIALLYLLYIPVSSLILFWAGPALASSLQLFYFGTYLPHRGPDEIYTDWHRAKSNDYPVWLSFITCYHFGYHYEHHKFPGVPWWRLPAVRFNAKTKA